MKRIYLIRHGLPEFPDGRRQCIGSTDLPLSGEGMLPASEMARALPTVSAVFSSPLTRAMETARAIRPDFTILDGLRELDYGQWEGLTFPEIRRDYPELYAAELAANAPMRAAIKAAVENGLPTAAECGGFLYLGQTLEDADGTPHLMAGVLPGQGVKTGRLVRFGYATLTAQADSMLFAAGEQFPAHEFHHWDCTAPGDSFTAKKTTGKQWDCAVSSPTLYAGYPHFHFYSNPAFAEGFIDTCIKEKHRHD